MPRAFRLFCIYSFFHDAHVLPGTVAFFFGNSTFFVYQNMLFYFVFSFFLLILHCENDVRIDK